MKLGLSHLVTEERHFHLTKLNLQYIERNRLFMMFSPGHMHKWQNPFPSNHLANVISLQLHKESKWIPLLACWNQRNCHGYPVVDIFLRFPFDDERGSQLLTFGPFDLLDFYFLCSRWWCHQYCPKMNMMATMLSGPGSILSHYWWSSRLHTVNPPTSALSMMITFWNYDDFFPKYGSSRLFLKANVAFL